MLLLLGILNLQFALNFVVPGAKSTEGGAVGFNGIGDAARIKRIGIGKRLAILINMVFFAESSPVHIAFDQALRTGLFFGGDGIVIDGKRACKHHCDDRHHGDDALCFFIEKHAMAIIKPSWLQR